MLACIRIYASEGACWSDGVFVCVFQCEHGCVWYISVSHLFLKHCGEWEVWISPNPVELTPVSLSARLLNCPVLHWIAASSTDNPQTMSNTDSSTALHWDIGGRHRPQKTDKTELKKDACSCCFKVKCIVWGCRKQLLMVFFYPLCMDDVQ